MTPLCGIPAMCPPPWAAKDRPHGWWVLVDVDAMRSAGRRGMDYTGAAMLAEPCPQTAITQRRTGARIHCEMVFAAAKFSSSPCLSSVRLWPESASRSEHVQDRLRAELRTSPVTSAPSPKTRLHGRGRRVWQPDYCANVDACRPSAFSIVPIRREALGHAAWARRLCAAQARRSVGAPARRSCASHGRAARASTCRNELRRIGAITKDEQACMWPNASQIRSIPLWSSPPPNGRTRCAKCGRTHRELARTKHDNTHPSLAWTDIFGHTHQVQCGPTHLRFGRGGHTHTTLRRPTFG